MHSLTKVELLPLTRELAKQFSEMKKMPGERELKAGRVNYFLDHLEAGTFGEPSWSQGFCRETKEMYRLDGQHTSSALASRMPEQFPKDRNVAIKTYEFDTVENDGAALFDMFDNPKSARSNSDMMGFYRAEHDDMTEIESTFCLQLANGIAEYQSTIKGGVVHPPRTRGLYYNNAEYRVFANWANEIFMDNAVVNEWLFAKSGVVAEMVSDWKIDKPTATEFWSYVLKESHPDRDHPTRELAEDFKKWRARPERHPQSLYRKHATKAWTRYRKEIELNRSRQANYQSPLPQSETQPVA